MYVKTCELCGKKFETKYPRQRFCKDPHVFTCAVCGKKVEVSKDLGHYLKRVEAGTFCCSKACSMKLAHANASDNQKKQVKKKQSDSAKKYLAEHGSERNLKSKKTKLAKYGDANFNNRKKYAETCQTRYGVSNAAKLDLTIQKVKQTKLERYGSETYNNRRKVKKTSVEGSGTENLMQNIQVKRKHEIASYEKIKSKKLIDCDSMTKHPAPQQKRSVDILKGKSKKLKAKKQVLISHICKLLNAYDIYYEKNAVVYICDKAICFDLAIPDYKILVNSCSSVNYNNINISYVTDLMNLGYSYIKDYEEKWDRAAKQVSDAIKAKNENAFCKDTDLYKLCRSEGFPYPQYPEKEMIAEYNDLCLYSGSTYKTNRRIGYKIIKNFHKSLYDCSVGLCESPRRAWEEDEKLKKVILNRYIYKYNLNPSKILQGFNISKIAPIVSIFNPALAKHLIQTYLSKYKEVFDPFSGFSGRMLGALACDKKYIGQDIRPEAVNESNNIIQFLGMCKRASVTLCNVLKSRGTYACLLTCPPYAEKEIYGHEVAFKSCDKWIDECLARFHCKTYVFVVDETDKYKDCIAETIQNNSHFSKAKEYVVVINK